MVKSVTKKVMWVGRATVFMVGLAVVFALTVGVASTALAGTGIGARFDLGKTNTVNAVSTLVGNVVGPSLLIDNNSPQFGATALRLEVEPGRPPLTVSSDRKVVNLNADRLDDREASSFANGVNGKATDADKLDGKSAEAFLQKSFERHNRSVFLEPGALEEIVVECLPGQVAVSGGFSGVGPGTHVFNSNPEGGFDGVPPDGWRVSVQNNSNFGDQVTAVVVCVNT